MAKRVVEQGCNGRSASLGAQTLTSLSRFAADCSRDVHPAVRLAVPQQDVYLDRRCALPSESDFGGGNTFDGNATYVEDWGFQLTSLVPQPLPGTGSGGAGGGAGGGDDVSCGNVPMGGGGAGGS